MQAYQISKNIKGTLHAYVSRMEFPRLYCTHIKNGKELQMDLEPHVNLIVQFMMHLLSIDGLSTENVWNEATESLTTPVFFLEGDQPQSSRSKSVLTKNMMRSIQTCPIIVNYLRRTAENWKTQIPKRLLSLRKKYPDLFLPGDKFDENQDNSPQFVDRNVSIAIIRYLIFTASLTAFISFIIYYRLKVFTSQI